MRSAPTAISYPQLRMLSPEGSLITPLPDYQQPLVFSISERFRRAPSLWQKRQARPEVLNSSWSDRQLTLRSNYAKDAYYTPITVDGLAFFEWRAERERAFTMRTQRTAALREAEAGGGGLKVNIPIRSRAVESLFGEGGAGLQVSGNRMISFAGVSNWRDGTGLSSSQSSRFPSLEMEQTYRFNIVGTIGSKIFVKVNQDSRINVPLANRLELRFKGSEDDVIKTIEAGNTTLSLPGATMLRYSSQVRGLFGIKTEAQVGPFQFTGIASQEKANTERTTIEAGARNVEEFFRDMDFIRWKIFDLGLPEHFESPQDEIIEYQLYKKATGNNTTNYLKAQMFLDPRPDPNNPGQVRDSSVSEGAGAGAAIELIEPDQYTLYSRQRTIILDRASVNASTVLGIWLKMRRPDNSTYEIGNVTSGGEGEAILYTLKLLKLDHPVSPGSNSRDIVVENYEWKNVYRIPSSLGIDFESPDLEALDLQVYSGVYGDERNVSNLSVQDNSIPYIQILGLDQVSSGAKVPDGESDLKSQIFDWSRRIFIMPSRFPFSADTTYGQTPGLNPKVPEIYNTSTSQSDRQAASKYYFKFTSKIRSNSIQLTGANIVEGSEVVTANGERLVRGNDYNVVGNSIQLISDRATDPGANVLVDYEVAPLFTVEKKTLLGGSLQYERGRDFKAGLVALFKSDKATTRKPKVGQETTKMFAYDLNTSFTLRPNFLTPIFDALPLVRAKGPSNVTISGEMARSHPNPNVDGEAFIDDFEGSRQELSLSTQRSRWRQSSRPVQLDPRYHPRAHMFWYNPLDPAVSSDVVYNEERTTAGGIIRPLTMVYEPTDIKIDTLVQEILAVDSFFTIDTITVDSQGVIVTVIDTTLDSTNIVYSDQFVSFYDMGVDRTDREAFRMQGTRGIPFEDNWGGIVYDFPSTVPNQSEAELLEIRLRIRKSKPGGYMHFDFGEISEDVIPDGVMQREDPQLEEWVNDDEPGDIGLDLMTNEQEQAWYAEVTDFLIDPADPSRDDFPYGSADRIITSVEPLNLNGQQQNLNHPDLNRLRKVNGTESNRFDIPLNYRVDTEDQLYNGDNDLDIANNYFSFKVSLDTAATEYNFFVPGSELPNPSDPNAAPFQTIRIPIQDIRSLDTAVGNATWTNIKYVRIWFDSLVDTTMVEIADMALVSSNWDDTIKYIDADRELTSPSVFNVSVVSDATDSGYSAPTGVTGNVDQINDITEREQSLRLSYENFIAGDTGVVSKPQPSTNYMTYGSLKMFVHGDESLGPNHRINYFFRMGSDSLNYYEFRTELQPGWAESNEVVFDFNELTALKDSAIQAELTDSTGRLNSGDAHPRYRVVGLPTLRSVRYIASLVCNANPDDTINGVTGEVWINELRVTDVRNDVGTAARATFSGNIGDFITSYSATVSYNDAFYRDPARGTRRDGGALGSGKSDLSYSFSMNIAADRLFPPSLGAKFPVRLSYSRNTSTPLLLTAANSDIVLPPGRQREERTISESRGFSIRESFRKNTKNPLFTVLLNNLSTHFNYTRNNSTSPTIPSAITENYDAGMTYNVQKLPEPPKAPVFFMLRPIPLLGRLADTRLDLLPDNFNIRSTFRRNLNVTQNNDRGSLTTRFTRTLDTDLRTSAKLLTNLSSNFSMSFKSDLRDPEWVNISLSDLRLGKVTRMQQNLSADYSPELFKWLTHQFSASSSYSENRRQNAIDIEASPADSALEPLDVSQSLRFTASGTFNLGGLIGKPTRGTVDRARRAREQMIELQRKRAREAREAQLRAKQAADSSSTDSAGADSAQTGDQDAAEETTEDEGPRGPWVGRRVFDFGRNTLYKLTSMIDPFSLSLEKGQSRAQNGLRYRPGASYRFGFSDEHNVPTAPLRTRPNNSFSQSISWRGSSGVNIFGGGVTTKVDISESRSRSFPTTGSGSESVDRNWPRLTISIRQIRGFEKIFGLNKVQGLLNSLIRRFSPQTSYGRRTSERRDLANDVVTSSSETVERTPLLAVNIPVRRQVTVNARIETSQVTRRQFELQTGRETGTTREKSSTVRLSTQYSFRAPQGIRLPIFGRVRIQSNVSLKLDVLKRFSKRESKGPGQSDFIANGESDNFSVTFNSSYSFSTQVRGGVSATWTDSRSDARKSHTRELRIFAEMSF